MTNNQLTEIPVTDGEIQCVLDAFDYRTGIESHEEYIVRCALAELQERRKAERGSEPVACMYDGEDGREYNGHNEFSGGGKGIPLYRHAQLSPERDQVRREHAEWSQTTFGNVGPVGPLRHLSKEALEAATEPDDLSEWADMQFLLWDAQRRAGITDEQITQAMVEKLAVNKQREWPVPKDGEPRLHIKEQSAPVMPNFKKLARDVVENLVDCGGLDAGVKEKYLKWTEETCRAAMLACTPQEIPVAPEKIEQSRKKVDHCDVCTEGVRGGCGTCAFNGNL